MLDADSDRQLYVMPKVDARAIAAMPISGTDVSQLLRLCKACCFVKDLMNKMRICGSLRYLNRRLPCDEHHLTRRITLGSSSISCTMQFHALRNFMHYAVLWDIETMQKFALDEPDAAHTRLRSTPPPQFSHRMT